MKFRQLSIITITFNDVSGLNRTINSLNSIIQGGAQLIVIDGSNNDIQIKPLLPSHTNYIRELDTGIYDALNKGLSRVSTDYFIILHSGDLIIESGFNEAFDLHLQTGNDLTLNAIQIVNNKKVLRTHSPYLWRKWMLNVQVQPPHLGMIYSSKLVVDMEFDAKLKIIGDYIFIKKMFDRNPSFGTTSILITEMISGGKTTNGVVSFYNVSLEFMRTEGLFKTLFCLLIRFVLKNTHRYNGK